MGYEIRRVPPNWEHPKDKQGNHQPMLDKDYESACQEWLNKLMDWESGKDPERAITSCRWYWEWAGPPPDEEYCRPKFAAEPTHYQIYETVSEGTPTSPVFASLDEMKEWLLSEGYSETASSKFVDCGWAPSMFYSPEKGLSPIGIGSLDWLD